MSASQENVIHSLPPEPSAATVADAPGALVWIRPKTGWQALDLGELWRHRELVYFLAWRDVKVRYKQTLLGVAWAILQPVLMMLVFMAVFGRLTDPQSLGEHYGLFVFAGLVPWTFFATAVSAAGQSVVASERLVTKVYFPRLAIPLAAVLAAVVDFALAGAVLALLCAWYGVGPGWSILLLPLASVSMALAAFGFGSLFAALNVAYRDVRHALPFVVQLWLLATPLVYLPPAAATESPSMAASQQPAASTGTASTLGSVRSASAGWLSINPLNGLIALFRASVLGGPLPWASIAWSLVSVPAVLALACYYFRRVEDSFADVI